MRDAGFCRKEEHNAESPALLLLSEDQHALKLRSIKIPARSSSTQSGPSMYIAVRVVPALVQAQVGLRRVPAIVHVTTDKEGRTRNLRVVFVQPSRDFCAPDRADS